MQTILGHSDDVDSSDAIEDVIAQCKERLGASVPKAGLLFSSVEYEHQAILDRIAQEWPGMPVVGGSSDGEISNALGFCHDSVLLTLFAGDDVEAHAGVGRNLSQGIAEAARAAMARCDAGEGSICLTTFAPSTNASEAVRELNRHLDKGACVVVGGLTGDHREFSRMREFFGREVLTDALPVLVLNGNLRCSWGIGSGWMPIGEPHRITRSEGHIVHEIDGEPALDMYHKHYGSVPDDSLGEYPLAIYPDGAANSWSLRAIMGSDPETHSLQFAGEVPQGALVRMTEVLPNGILSGSAESLRAALDAYPGEAPRVALIFSCAARKWVLGTQAKEEVRELTECLEGFGLPDLPIAGLYCFGEIAPLPGGDSSEFHNETCVSLILGD